MSGATSFETILTEQRGRVGLVSLNRPKALNALNAQVMRDVVAAFEAFDRDPSVGCSSEVQALFAIGVPDTGGWGTVTPISPEAEFTTNAGPNNDELAIRAPSLFVGYLDDPGARDAVMSEDGWFRTGDRAERDGNGFVFGSRIGDVLRLGGFLVAPQEIEAFLQRQPGIAGALVVGVETDRGVAAFAFVFPQAGATVDEAALLQSCRESLARYKVPVRAVPVASFPTSNGPNGPKISRAELRRTAVSHLARHEKETECI